MEIIEVRFKGDAVHKFACDGPKSLFELAYALNESEHVISFKHCEGLLAQDFGWGRIDKWHKTLFEKRV